MESGEGRRQGREGHDLAEILERLQQAPEGGGRQELSRQFSALLLPIAFVVPADEATGEASSARSAKRTEGVG
jgi:hypothetical protein